MAWLSLSRLKMMLETWTLILLLLPSSNSVEGNRFSASNVKFCEIRSSHSWVYEGRGRAFPRF